MDINEYLTKLDNEAGCPSEFDSPADKIKESWGLRYARFAWEDAVSGGAGYFETNKDRWINNRRFSEGLHDLNKYKKQALPSETEWITVNYSVGTPAPKILRIVKTRILDNPYRPTVNMGDSFVKGKLDDEKNKILAKMELANMIRQLKAQGILPEGIMPESIKDTPSDPDDIEMYQNTTFQVAEAVILNKLIRQSFKNNKVRNLEKRIVDDLVNTKIGAIYCSINENYEFTTKYIDPVKLVTSYCSEPDYSDWKHIGHWQDVTVSEFRQMANGKYTDQEIFDIVKKSPSNKGDHTFMGIDDYYDLTESQQRKLEGYSIRLFYFETLQSDRKVYVEKEGEEGYIFFDEKDPSYELSEKSKGKKKLTKGIITRIYEGVWVVNTPYMIRWRLKPNVIRKINGKKYASKPESSYIIRQPGQYEMRNKSMVEEAIPHIELMIVYSIKLQHFVAMAAPPGTEIDVASQAAALIGMGMDGADPKILTEIYKSTGVKYFSSIREDGTPIMNSRPVNDIPSTIDQGIIHLSELYNLELARLKEIMGVNDAVDSSTPDSRRLKGVMQQAQQAFSTTIKELTDVYLEMIEEVASRAAYHQVVALINDKETEEVKELLSEAELAMIKAVEFDKIMFNTYIEMLPDQYEIEQIYIDMASAIKQGSLAIEDSISIRRALREGNSDKAELLMEQKMRKKAMQEAKMEQQRNQLAMQAQQQKIQAESEKEAQSQRMKLEGELAKIKADQENIILKEQENRQTVTLKGDIDKELLELAHKLKVQAEVSGAGYDADNDTMPKEIGGEPSVSRRV